MSSFIIPMYYSSSALRMVRCTLPSFLALIDFGMKEYDGKEPEMTDSDSKLQEFVSSGKPMYQTLKIDKVSHSNENIWYSFKKIIIWSFKEWVGKSRGQNTVFPKAPNFIHKVR